MRVFSTLALAGCMCLAVGSQAFADVRITMREGRVSLSAKDATVRQILTEWARVGRTQIVNVERIAGGPITIEFTNVPEAEALDMLLRSLSGYMVAPRAVAIADASNFDRIIVMPTSASPRPAVSASASAPPPPAPFGQMNGIMQPPQEDENNQAPGAVQLPPALAPIFNNLNLQPQPAGANPRRPGNTGGPQPGSRHLRHDAAAGTAAPASAGRAPRAAGGQSVWRRIRTGHDRGSGRFAARPAGSTGPAAAPLVERRLMPLVDEVGTAIADAMRQHDAVRLSALRMLKAAFMNKSVEKKRDLDDAEARQIVAALVKQRKDSIEQFTKGGRDDLAKKEAAEIVVLEAYLPAAADPAAVDDAVAAAIAETGATSPKDMGRVMKAVMAKLAGQNVDGKTVNDLVRRKLGA